MASPAAPCGIAFSFDESVSEMLFASGSSRGDNRNAQLFGET